ncbi:hypothetical protein D918_00562 [Trichuris suis]|nr:hypothetical protein D918_00562 [Trichuris suis]
MDNRLEMFVELTECVYRPEEFCAAFGLALLRKLANFEVADEDDEPAENIVKILLEIYSSFIVLSMHCQERFDSGSLPSFCLEVLTLLARVDMKSQWHIIMGEYERTAALVQRCIVEVFHGGSVTPSNSMDSSEVAQINAELRQHRCVIKAACCLAGPVDAWNCADHFERCYEFLSRHCEMTLLFMRSFFNKPKCTYGVFEESIVSTMVTVLLCFRSYAPWLSSFYADAQQSGNRNVEVSLLVSTALKAATAVLRDSQFCGKLTQAAVLTQRSILLTVRPHSFVLSMNDMQSLYQQSIDGLYKCLPDDVRNALYVSLANYLILPWYNAVGEEQEWSQRKPTYEQLVRSILADYFALVDTEQSVPYEMAAPVIKKAAPLIVALLDSIESEGAITKRTCYDVMRPFGKDCVQSLLELLSRLLRTLIMQFGVDFTKQLSSTLFDLCASADFSNGLQAETEEATSVLEWVLSTIVVQTSSKFSSLLPEVAALVIGPLFNLVRKSDTEVVQSYYELLGKIICARSRQYFVPSPDELDATAKEELRSFMIIFCAGIVELELETAKVVIGQLNMLHAKHSLYTKEVFLSQYYNEFVGTLFVTLVNREHDILLDDICDTLAIMACPNLNQFCNKILPAIMETSCGLSKEQAARLCGRLLNCHEVPTFSVTFKGVVHDTDFCRLMNSLATA